MHKKPIKPPGNLHQIRIYLLVTSVLFFGIVLLLVPVLIGWWNREEEAELLLKLSWQAWVFRFLGGLAAGIIFSLWAIKKSTTTQMVQYIRFFLLTFILLLTITYIAFKSN